MSKKLAASSLVFQALEKFIETQNKKKNSIPVRAFSENPPFCIFYYIGKSCNWRTLGHIMDIFSSCHFHNASKKCFWPKKISNFMHGFKSATLAKLENCQNSTFEPVHEIKFFFLAKRLLLRHFESAIYKKYS